MHLLNESLILSIGCQEKFHDLNWQQEKCKNKSWDVFSILYIPIGRIKLFFLCIQFIPKISFHWFKCEKLEIELFSDHDEVIREINDKLKIKSDDFLKLKNKKREYWIKELENLLNQITKTIEGIQNKSYIFFSLSLIFVSIIGGDLFKIADFLVDIFSTSKLFFFTITYLIIHIFIYLVNIIIFSLYLFSLRKSVARTFKDFCSENSPILAYFKDLYFRWYFKRNKEYPKIVEIAYYIQRYVIYTLVFILIAVILSFIYTQLYQTNILLKDKYNPFPSNQILIASSVEYKKLPVITDNCVRYFA